MDGSKKELAKLIATAPDWPPIKIPPIPPKMAQRI
jgi:hypothetical protein